MSALIKFLLTLAWGCEVVAGKLRGLGNRLDTLGMPDPGFHPAHCFNCGEDSDDCDEYGMCPVCAPWLSPIPASKSPAIQELKAQWGLGAGRDPWESSVELDEVTEVDPWEFDEEEHYFCPNCKKEFLSPHEMFISERGVPFCKVCYNYR